MRRLSAPAVKEHLETTSDSMLLDVREPWEFEFARLEGAVNVPMGTIPNAVQIRELMPEERDVVVICHHGVRSLQVAHYLEASGFPKVINLEGGLEAWSLTVDASVPRY